MRIAVSGPAYSGKTSIARWLELNGFARVDYTGFIKQRAADALTSIGGQPVTAKDMELHKQDYRAFLQSVGVLAKFNEGYGVMDALHSALDTGEEHIVFDNVRFLAQMEILRLHSFVLVTVTASEGTRASRAYEKHGLSLRDFHAMSEHIGETSYPTGNILVNGDAPLHHSVKDLLCLAGVEPVALPKLIYENTHAS